MATKKQKRERAEAKRAAFLAQVREEGLAAQKADQDYQKTREKRMDVLASAVNQRHRTTLLNNGINPTTGLLFTDEEMAVMKEKANTAERKNLYERIVAGRNAVLNQQAPLGQIDPLEGMTVGEFRDKMDQFYTGMGWNL